MFTIVTHEIDQTMGITVNLPNDSQNFSSEKVKVSTAMWIWKACAVPFVS